jgi:hypothetical protein
MRQKSGRLALMALFVLLVPVLALAQENSVRKPVSPPVEQEPSPPPVRMEFKSKGQSGSQSGTQAGSPAGAQSGNQSGNQSGEQPRPSKFPNIDTAKNRRDYDISTPKADGIRLGRDEESGDTVLGTTPRKKKQQADPYANPPIEVRPIIRGF